MASNFLHRSVRHRIFSRFLSLSSPVAASKPKKRGRTFTDTCLLPKTDFPLRVASKDRAERDTWIHQEAKFDELYSWQWDSRGKEKGFVLHDGPPYANGSAHMGHAVNKILKDITVRYRVLKGQRVHYRPGWDCHGLPIELKAKEGGRDAARLVATQAIDVQRDAFRRWGVIGCWADPYLTYDPVYVGRQLEAFCDLYDAGYIFRAFKPVYWSPSAGTALAEAELEYYANHRSNAAYIAFPLVASTLNEPVAALIWTTTPWTIPANQAICVHPNLKYTTVQRGNCRYIIAELLADKVASLIGGKPDSTTFYGHELAGATYRHVLNNQILPILMGEHVTVDKGTGLVHTAPAHGPDDFLVALKNKIDVLSIVDESGRFSDLAGSLSGLDVLGEGTEKVLAQLGDSVLHHEQVVHSYPYDWRTKKPVIVRASLQWFVDTDRIKNRALEYLDDVSIVPKSFQNGMVAQLERRPYWCISRQRKWGVPIPALYQDGSDEPIVSRKVAEALTQKGIDSWWTCPLEELLGDDIRRDLKKGQDIMDIWFDSGISWYAALDSDVDVADVYLEGQDQFTGWFQSSLLLSVALRNKAPYRTIFVHGFTVDEKGRKMSKSLGNVIDPSDVTDSSGVDVLRWWVACHAWGQSVIPVSPSTIQSSQDAVHKIRIVLRFLLGALNGFKRKKEVPTENMTPLDQYMMTKLHQFCQQMDTFYAGYHYKRAGVALLNFVTNDVSAFYCHLVKDRLYCDVSDGPNRLSCLTVLSHMLDALVKSAAPITPHLSEEVALHDLTQEWRGAFKRGTIAMDKPQVDPDVVESVLKALEIRDSINQQTVGQNLREYNAVICADSDLGPKLQTLPSDTHLCEILQVSGVSFSQTCSPGSVSVTTDGATVVLVETKARQCQRCRNFTVLTNNILCQRCVEVIATEFAK